MIPKLVYKISSYPKEAALLPLSFYPTVTKKLMQREGNKKDVST